MRQYDFKTQVKNFLQEDLKVNMGVKTTSVIIFKEKEYILHKVQKYRVKEK